MKHERMTISMCAVSVLMGALISFSCLMCLVQAYDLACDPWILIMVCCLTSGVAAAVMCIKKSWLITLGVFSVYLIVMIWKNEIVAEGVSAVLYHVTLAFEKCFRNVSVMGSPVGDVHLFLAALAIPLAWLTVWTICRESYAAFVIVSCLPFLCLSLIIVNIAPNLWLVLLTAALVLLIISDNVRTSDAHAGSVLIAWLALPLAVLIVLLVTLSPVEDYSRSGWSQMLQQIAEEKLGVERWRKREIAQAVPGSSESNVDLSTVGPRKKNGEMALHYYADTEISYLRGMTYSRYMDSSWDNLTAEEFKAYSLPKNLMTCPEEAAVLQVETAGKRDVIYTPYYPSVLPQGSEAHYDTYVRNKEGSTTYSVTYGSAELAAADDLIRYEQFVADQYALLPESMLQPLYDVLIQNDLLGATPQEIADFVQSSGVYDLNTPQVPEGEDFILYFLTQSNRGYCVHFASSTAMLLRAAGIPSRYVTGYSVNGAAGQWNTVTEDEAHAWVEYYEFGVGWVPLDPTPGEWREYVVQIKPEQPEQSEQPEEPEKPEEPKQPEQPEEPEEPKQPHSEQAPTADQTQQAAQPAAAGKTEKTAKVDWYWFLLILPAVMVAAILRRVICLSIRKAKRKKGEPNRRALYLWSGLVRLYKADKMKVPEELLCLAEKAKFSQHTLTEEELRQLEDGRKSQISHLKKLPILRRLWHQYGRVLY